jgi:hypothetical protein
MDQAFAKNAAFRAVVGDTDFARLFFQSEI